MSQWLEAITKARGAEVEKPPRGWLTRAEVHQQIGKSPAQCDNDMRRLIQTGRMERQTFKALTAGGVKPLPHFRLK